MKRTFAVALLAVGLVGLAVTPLLVQMRTLSVSEGSVTGTVEGNFTSITDNRYAIIRYFNATTYANQSGGPTSTLTLQLYTATVYAPALSDPVTGQPGVVMVDIEAAIRGAFASNLHLSGLTFTFNETGRLAGAMGHLDSLGPPYPINVSHPDTESAASGLVAGFVGPDSGSITPTLLNQTGRGMFYEFLCPVAIQFVNAPGYNEFVGFRATVTGPFTPNVSVAILLQVIDLPGGVWE